MTETDPKLEALSAAVSAAREARAGANTAYGLIARERDKERAALISALDVELAEKYGERLAAAKAVHTAAFDGETAAQIAFGKAKLEAIPDRRVFEWGNVGTGYGKTAYGKTGREGLLEVRLPGTRFPTNQTHGLPDIGDIFVRLLKKDGTPSTQFARIGVFGGNPWKPVDYAPPSKS